MTSSTDSRSFLEIFASVADKHRQKPAIVTEGRHTVTYGQLFSKAIRIATQIVTADNGGGGTGIAEGAPIGIYITKSAEYIASMLGIWISSGAFVPIDPALPKDRVQYIVNHLAMPFALVRDGSGAMLSNLGVRTLSVDGSWEEDDSFEKYGKGPFSIPAYRPAYYIFTSGSTGRPKGVEVTHAGIVNFLTAQIDAFNFSHRSNSLFVLSTNFDASVSDIGCALLSGATLFIEPQGLLTSGPQLLELMKERQITHVDVPPSLLKTIPNDQAPPSLETIIIGGEACAPDVVQAWARKALVVNVYGPTEATVCTSLGACDADTWERPLIGQPLPNVEYIILDENQQEVPQGTPGELYIGGIQLATCYIHEPELTRRKFVRIDGKRLYRTGDLVVHCIDGEYQFIGRVDRQFKLRGMLVEPEEIEARLASHPDIARTGVLKRPLRMGFPGDKLVAFVQPRKGRTIDSNDLRKHLSKSLPLWMIPQLFEIVDDMPLTVTGKVDLSLLKETPLKSIGVATLTIAETPTQKILSEVWQQILGLESIGIHDDFFDLGGDSLNVIEAVLAAHLKGLTISPDMLVAHSSISDLSEMIDNLSSNNHTNYPGGNALSSDFLRQDVDLDEDLKQLAERWRPSAYANRSILKNVLLTGATGFLGSRLLYELLSRTEARIYCLVRAPGGTEAIERIERSLSVHEKTLSSKDKDRLSILLGDLSLPNFGIRDNTWSHLSLVIDTVFHSAALVNVIKDYFDLRPANVVGTKEIARFVLAGSPKHLHYASTLSVFVATNHNTGIAKEEDALDGEFQVYGGYAQTKFAAELLLRSIADKAGPISFYRFGLLTGDSQTGKSAKDDFLNMFARGISTLGCVPESDAHMTVDITPVDYAAAAMAHIAVKDTIAGTANTYHIANTSGLSLKNLLQVMGKLDISLDVLPAKKFLTRLKSKAHKFNSEESAACLALCRALGNDESFAQFRTMDLFQATGISFDSTNTQAALKGTSIVCPAPSNELIELYLREALL